MFGGYFKRFWRAISLHSSSNLFKNVSQIMEIASRLLERIKDLIRMHLGALVSGFVNILVLFYK